MVMVWRSLAAIWMLPSILVVWLFYLLPLLAFGYVKWTGFVEPWVAELRLSRDDNWYTSLWVGWAGFSAPCALILNHTAVNDEDVRQHELRHCAQQRVLGVLFYPVYGAIWLAVAVAAWLGLTKRHPYRDHPLERDARAYASRKIQGS